MADQPEDIDQELTDEQLAALENIGEVTLDSTGLSLPIDGAVDKPGEAGVQNSTEEETPADALPPRPITGEDLAELATVEAELDLRWPETKIDPSLERIELLMDLLGHPEQTFATIQVAGTNGKTSTVRLIDSLLRAFHRRTGRTTSPHLQLVTERIAVDGKPIHPQDYIETWREIEPMVQMVDAQSAEEGGPPMSKFEVLVALAYASFADAPVEVAVIETGMGGTWDATNVVNSDVAVVTPIGMDHTDFLGETLEEIAGEKAGIIKRRKDGDDPAAPEENIAIIAEQEPEAMRVLMQQAVEVDAAVARAGSEFGVIDSSIAVGGQQVTIRGLSGVYEDIFLPLSGEHQARNAATALAAVEAFFGAGPDRQLDIDKVREGFATVGSPGRLERVRSAPSVFIDASHNPHGAQALASAMDRDFDFRRLIGVVAVLGDKDARGILEALEPVLDEIVITETTSPRALPTDVLAEYAMDAFGDERVHVAYDLPGAVETAIQLAEDDVDGVVAGAGVLITGSVVTAGKARTLFGKQPE